MGIQLTGVVEYDGLVGVRGRQTAEDGRDHAQDHAEEHDGLDVVEEIRAKDDLAHGLALLHDVGPEAWLLDRSLRLLGLRCPSVPLEADLWLTGPSCDVVKVHVGFQMMSNFARARIHRLVKAHAVVERRIHPMRTDRLRLLLVLRGLSRCHLVVQLLLAHVHLEEAVHDVSNHHEGDGDGEENGLRLGVLGRVHHEHEEHDLKEDRVDDVDYLQGILDHHWVVQVRERVLVGHAFQEELVHVVVFYSFWHLLVEVSWLPRPAHLDVDLLLALAAELVLVEAAAVVRAETLGALQASVVGSLLSHAFIVKIHFLNDQN